MKQSIAAEAEIAKVRIANSKVDDDTKRNFIELINTSEMATNGITQEQKVQALTECMARLSFSLATFLDRTESRISNIEDLQAREHPADRMKYIKSKEEELAEIEAYRNSHNIIPNITIDGKNVLTETIHIKKKDETKQDADSQYRTIDKILDILKMPMIWVFASVAACSPHAADVINAIISIWSK